MGCAAVFGAFLAWQSGKYSVSDRMELPVKEFSTAEYPEDPAERSLMHGRYRGRHLTLIKKGDRLFDFVLESSDSAVARRGG